MKTTGVAAELLKIHMCWFDRETDCRIKEIVLKEAKTRQG